MASLPSLVLCRLFLHVFLVKPTYVLWLAYLVRQNIRVISQFVVRTGRPESTIAVTTFIITSQRQRYVKNYMNRKKRVKHQREAVIRFQWRPGPTSSNMFGFLLQLTDLLLKVSTEFYSRIKCFEYTVQTTAAHFSAHHNFP